MFISLLHTFYGHKNSRLRLSTALNAKYAMIEIVPHIKGESTQNVSNKLTQKNLLPAKCSLVCAQSKRLNADHTLS